MTYTGRVEVGGPADVAELGGLTLSKLAVGPLDNNVYLLRAAQARDSGVRSLLIDAAAEPDRILELIGDDGVDAVLTTHRHGDHWLALDDVIAATGATTMAGSNDADAIDVVTDRRLAHGDTLTVGDVELEVIELRGHTPGSIALAFTDAAGTAHIISGDSLFPGGVGRTTPDTFPQLFADVTTRIFDRFGDDTWVHPGHGWDTTLGVERPQLDEWRTRGW